jgi:hypothetical protein
VLFGLHADRIELFSRIIMFRACNRFFITIAAETVLLPQETGFGGKIARNDADRESLLSYQFAIKTIRTRHRKPDESGTDEIRNNP